MAATSSSMNRERILATDVQSHYREDCRSRSMSVSIDFVDCSFLRCQQALLKRGGGAIIPSRLSVGRQ